LVSLSQEKFEKIVDDALAKVPKKFLDKLNNVAVVIQDFPNPDQLKGLGVKNGRKEKRSYLLLGLYQGVPQTKRWGGGSIFPDKITIFKNPIERLANSEEDIKKIVKDTVKHEIAHHFGFSEEDIRKAGKG